MASSTKQYTLDEVAKHCTETDCWIAVNEKVYDVTAFLSEHPGITLRYEFFLKANQLEHP
jgi:cytochrome b involved in lipid metabolism